MSTHQVFLPATAGAGMVVPRQRLPLVLDRAIPSERPAPTSELLRLCDEVSATVAPGVRDPSTGRAICIRSALHTTARQRDTFWLPRVQPVQAARSVESAPAY